MADTLKESSKMPNNKLSVIFILPALNEGKVIGDVIASLNTQLRKTSYNYEVLVIDDGSYDNTASEARRANATVIKHILNTGAGGATSTGLCYAKLHNFDYAVTLDSDGQHDPQDAVAGVLCAHNNKTDLLIGSRLIDTKGMSKTKVLGNKGLSTITHVLFGIQVTDSQSGLRVFSKRAIQSLNWRSAGYEFCSEMLWRAHQLGLKIDEYPIKAIYTDYSISKGQKNWNAVNIVRSLLQRRIMEFIGE